MGVELITGVKGCYGGVLERVVCRDPLTQNRRPSHYGPCSSRASLSWIGVVFGGCYGGPLSRRVEGGVVDYWGWEDLRKVGVLLNSRG